VSQALGGSVRGKTIALLGSPSSRIPTTCDGFVYESV
jgi:hypothetical protein